MYYTYYIIFYINTYYVLAYPGSTGPITHTCLISANVTRRRPGTRPPASTALLDSTSVDLPFSLFILLSPTDRYSPLIFTLLSYLTRPVLLTYLFTEGT